MQKSTPIKTDLFRFITFRSPEQLTFQNKNLRFVTHPDLQKSIVNACPLPTGKEATKVKLEEFTKRFPAFSSKLEVRNINPALFDFANNALKKKISLNGIEQEGKEKMQTLSAEQETKLFDALIGEVISKKSKEVRQSIGQLLIVNHALKHSKPLVEIGVRKLADIKIEIPYQAIECYKPWWFNRCGGSLEGVQNLGIADFRRVEQEVCCYVPGEVSHIENIMAKEYKERSTRNYVRTEISLETNRETEIETLNDVTTATRNEISSEIAQVLEQEKSSNYGGSLGVSAEYMKAQIDVNAYADFATSNSSSYSNTEAKTYAEDVTKRALEKIVQKTSEKRTSKIIKEFEENNKHGFDNRNGDKHVTGIYRWIDIIYTNRLVNYGKRLMVEFMVPEPAEFYKRALKYKPIDTKNESVDVSDPPKKLEEFQLTKPADITAQNISNAASYYGVTLNTLPASEIILTKDLSPISMVDHNRNINTQSLSAINVPNDYEAATVIGSYTYEYRAGSSTSAQQAFCDFTFGGNIIYSGKDYSGTKKSKTVSISVTFNPNIGGTIPVSVGYSGCFGFYGAVSVKCVLKASVTSDWQTECYNRLLAAYNRKLDDYNAEQAANSQAGGITGSEEEKRTNPALNRIIEQRELKRICIEMLIKPFCKVQGRKNFTDQNACDLYQIPQVNQTKEFTEYASMVKFFEQAIDWQIMSYLFYPYYWADKCDWAGLMQSESDDAVFQAFLQSGMARLVVPIRLQFTEAFAYYLETGEIWLGNELVAGTPSDLYLSIAEEMQTLEGAVEEEWETRVPTSLAIVQDKSAKLEEEGLPCCHKVENEETTTNISGSENILEIIKP
ncbi:MAG: uncharacterized protein JWP69_1741 [Flaviaesturariibacter sp.]|nr:uncharacterized protein [Flaviaesturariibacter sp.]